uniref:RRM domain-containing protein n=1 Tax=Amphimedon queenslandica TaxID=400682 RepID=A0A1X7U8R1_AMPQE
GKEKLSTPPDPPQRKKEHTKTLKKEVSGTEPEIKREKATKRQGSLLGLLSTTRNRNTTNNKNDPRTVFIGNIPLATKKKDILKLVSLFGLIERSIAVSPGNVPFGTDEEKLRKVFESCGLIDGIHIVKDTRTGINKGFANFAYVKFKDSSACKNNERIELEGPKLRVCCCHSDKSKFQTKFGGAKSQAGRNKKFLKSFQPSKRKGKTDKKKTKLSRKEKSHYVTKVYQLSDDFLLTLRLTFDNLYNISHNVHVPSDSYHRKHLPNSSCSVSSGQYYVSDDCSSVTQSPCNPLSVNDGKMSQYSNTIFYFIGTTNIRYYVVTMTALNDTDTQCVTLSPEKMEEAQSAGIHKKFKLVSNMISTGIMILFDYNGCLKKYYGEIEILKEFYDVCMSDLISQKKGIFKGKKMNNAISELESQRYDSDPVKAWKKSLSDQPTVEEEDHESTPESGPNYN